MAPSVKTQLKKQIEATTNKRNEAQASFTYWQTELRQLESELDRLEAALAALEGRMHVPAPGSLLPEPVSFDRGGPPNVHPAAPPTGQPAPTPNIVLLNGEPYILEPGYKVAKNSFNEDCVVPIDAPDVAQAAEEPVKPEATPDPLGVVDPNRVAPAVAVTTGDFDSPEDMF